MTGQRTVCLLLNLGAVCLGKGRFTAAIRAPLYIPRQNSDEGTHWVTDLQYRRSNVKADFLLLALDLGRCTAASALPMAGAFTM